MKKNLVVFLFLLLVISVSNGYTQESGNNLEDNSNDGIEAINTDTDVNVKVLIDKLKKTLPDEESREVFDRKLKEKLEKINENEEKSKVEFEESIESLNKQLDELKKSLNEEKEALQNEGEAKKDNAINKIDEAINKVNKESKDNLKNIEDKADSIKNEVKDKVKEIANDVKEEANDKALEIENTVKAKLYDNTPTKHDNIDIVSSPTITIKAPSKEATLEVSKKQVDVQKIDVQKIDEKKVEVKKEEVKKAQTSLSAKTAKPSLYDKKLDWEDEEKVLKREKFIADYKQAKTNEALVDMLRSKALDARIDQRGIIINLENALFDFNSAKLTDKALPSIKEIAIFLQSLNSRTVLVEGHTDSVGTVMYNKKLSEGRAQSVVEELVKNGVSRSRLEYKGYGESDPIATNRTQEGRDRNRRVELVISNK